MCGNADLSKAPKWKKRKTLSFVPLPLILCIYPLYGYYFFFFCVFEGEFKKRSKIGVIKKEQNSSSFFLSFSLGWHFVWWCWCWCWWRNWHWQWSKFRVFWFASFFPKHVHSVVYEVPLPSWLFWWCSSSEFTIISSHLPFSTGASDGPGDSWLSSVEVTSSTLGDSLFRGSKETGGMGPIGWSNLHMGPNLHIPFLR